MTKEKLPGRSITSVTLRCPDPAASEAFYTAAFDLGPQLGLRRSDSPTTGFRGFTLSLVVGQPANVDALIRSALDAGATSLKPVKKSLSGLAASCLHRTGRSGRSPPQEEGHRAGHPADRRHGAPAGCRRHGRHQAVLRRPGLRRGQELRKEVRRNSPPRRRTSSWRCMGARPWPRMPASPPRAPDHTGSSSAATPGPSPIRTASRGRQSRKRRARSKDGIMAECPGIGPNRRPRPETTGTSTAP